MLTKKILLGALLALSSLSGAAVTPLWLRNVVISPDGKEIAFTYKGDVYKVNANGGEAVRLTTQDSYETSPVWSPDSRMIAFSSDRFGSGDVFVMSSNGGQATRLTYNSVGETPSAFSVDGKFIYYSANIQSPSASALYPEVFKQLYKVPVAGGRSIQEIAVQTDMIDFSKDGKTMLYQDRKGYEDTWRKHHTSSVTSDIWSYDVATAKHTNLTNRGGEDRNPVYSPNEDLIYFLSERNGESMNVYSMDAKTAKNLTKVTSFATHPVRFLSMSNNGTMCFTYDGEIYTKSQNQSPKKVSINITSDDYNSKSTLRFGRGATSFSVSPNSKEVAFVVRGEVFVTSVEYGTTKQITNTVNAEDEVDFGKDNRSVVYAAERDGVWGIYRSKIKREEDLNFANATVIEEEKLTPNDSIDRQRPMLSPDGKELAFIENEYKLMVMNLESKEIRQVTDGSQWFCDLFNYAWSPDGKWFTLEIIGNGHDPYSDVAIIKADGTEKAVNLTNSGYFSLQPKWVLDGNAVLFITDRYGMRSHASWGSLNDVMLVFMNKDSYDKFRLNEEDYALLKELEKEQAKAKEKAEGDKKDKKSKKDKDKAKKEEKSKDIVVELDGIEDRILRLTPNSSDLSDAMIADKGENLYYLSAFEDGYDLWKMDLRKKETTLMKKLGLTSQGSLVTDKDQANMFIMSAQSFKKMKLASGKIENISYSAEMKMDLSEERAYMFEHVCRQEARHFYRTDMHGVDWEMMTAAYRKFLPHIDNNADFAELLSEMLGELNVSHTGGRYRGAARGERTADLGLFYDLTYTGKGLKITEIIAGGPFDRKTTKVKPGVVIEKINGVEIAENDDNFKLLNNLIGKKTLVSLYNQEDDSRWEEVIKPISSGRTSLLLYDRWVKQRAADVEKWSNGRLGYVHIESMNDDSFRTVYSDILGKYNKCEGIVIDTRFNGGGRLHEDIEILFSGEKYLTQVFRGRETCDMPSRRWNKPSIMVQCEANYSNAHGTPWVYKHKGMGKLVGAPVPGTMTSVSWERLQDSSLIFGTPVIGYRTAEGNYLENSQLEPDVYVLNAPETVVKGEDTQLKVAVEELLKQLDAEKK